jgi:hypothetical protein
MKGKGRGNVAMVCFHFDVVVVVVVVAVIMMVVAMKSKILKLKPEISFCPMQNATPRHGLSKSKMTS